MKNQSFLTFSLNGNLLAIATNTVREIIWLPELTLIEEYPAFITGVINIHGSIVPVMDLNVRFGHTPQRYDRRDRVIILGISEFIPEQQPILTQITSIGIIVNDVLDVITIPEESIEPSPYEKRKSNTPPHFVSGEANTGDDLVMIIDPRTFFDSEFGNEEPDNMELEKISGQTTGYFCPEADSEERKIFHNRAINLKQKLDDEDAEKPLLIAVVSMNREYLCVELEMVREFSKIHNFTHLPCCPEHIAGNMNLRGNVLTVVDISGLLNVQAVRISESTKVIVAESGEYPIGVIVDEILDIIYLKESDIIPIPSSVSALNGKFVKGALPYGSAMMALLDFREILSWDGLIVNEEV